MPFLKKQKYWVSMLYVLLFLLWFFPAPASAKELPSGLLIGDESGIYADDSGKYYIDLVSVMPGDRYEKEITIRGLDLKDPFTLGLLVNKKESKGSLDWNNHILLTLILDQKEIYQGPLLGNGTFDWTLTPLDLGSISYGKDKILKAVFEVDKELTVNDFLEASELQYSWTFIATRKPIEESSSTTESSTTSSSSTNPGGKLPKTGDSQQKLMLVLGVFFLLCVLLLVLKRRKEEDDDYD